MNASHDMHRPLPKITAITMHVLTPMVGFIEYRHVRMTAADEQDRKDVRSPTTIPS